MRAAAFREYGGPEVLVWDELPDPVPAPDEVLVRVHACGLNHSDLDSRAGTSRWPFPLPHVLGAELAGVVAQLGSAVTGYEIGQPVTALQELACGRCATCARWRPDLCPQFQVFGTDRWGGYAELVRVPARALIPLRSASDAVAAAAVQCTASTAWHMVVALAAVRPQETVLVPSGSGGVASAAIQIARLAGARVIATVGAPEKAGAVRRLGADEVFSYREQPVRETVLELTGGRGVDAVIDTVGGPLFPEHLAALAPDGRLAICGAHAGERVEIDLIELFRRGQRILGFRRATPDGTRTALQLALDGQIQIPVDRTFALAQAADAHVYMSRREHVGKVVLVQP